MFGFSLPFLQSVFFWATITAAIAGGVSITAAFLSAMVGYQVTDLVQADANKRIADAAAKSDEARAEAAKANAAGEAAKADTEKARAEIAEAAKQTELAKAGAAEANQKAEAERLERLKLEAVVAPRSLSLQQQQMLAAAWRALAGTRVAVISYSLDGEGAGLATQIMAALQAAGVVVDNRLASIMPMGGFSLGVHVTGADASVADPLRGALATIGNLAVATPGSPQGGGASMGVGPAPGTSQPVAAEILVGVKPVATIR